MQPHDYDHTTDDSTDTDQLDRLTLTDLRVLAALVGESQRLLGVIRAIETRLGCEIDHDRAYRRTERLHDRGLIGIDDTGRYHIRPSAVEALADELAWLAGESGHRLSLTDATTQADD